MRPPFLGHEGAGILDKVGDDLADPQLVTVDIEAGLRIVLALDDEAELHGLLAAADLAGNIDEVAQQLLQIDGLGVAAGKLGIEPRSVGDVADQAVEAAHVMLDDIHQPLLGIVRAGKRQRFDGAAQRCQRVFQFMADVGGKILDRSDTVVERRRHLAKGDGEVADLVLAGREIRDFLALLGAAAPHADGGG